MERSVHDDGHSFVFVQEKLRNGPKKFCAVESFPAAQ